MDDTQAGSRNLLKLNDSTITVSVLESNLWLKSKARITKNLLGIQLKLTLQHFLLYFYYNCSRWICLDYAIHCNN